MPYDDHDIRAGVPSVDDYRRLRTRSGLSDKSPEGAAVGLANTWHGVLVHHGGRPVGTGRIIGDGGCFFQADTAPESIGMARFIGAG